MRTVQRLVDEPCGVKGLAVARAEASAACRVLVVEMASASGTVRRRWRDRSAVPTEPDHPYRAAYSTRESGDHPVAVRHGRLLHLLPVTGRQCTTALRAPV